MARVIITIEDNPDGGVKTAVQPGFDVLQAALADGYELTSAQAYALFAIRKIMEASKENEPGARFRI